MPANALPNDIDTLKRMLVSRDETIVKLVAEIARLKRWQYGRSSERLGELTVIVKLVVVFIRSQATFLSVVSDVRDTVCLFSGFRCTTSILAQLRTEPDHRSGCRARAVS